MSEARSGSTSAFPVPVSGSNGPSPTLLLGGLGIGLALLGVGIALVPVWSVPVSLGLKIEHNRQTIAVCGLAIGAACLLVGVLTKLSGG